MNLFGSKVYSARIVILIALLMCLCSSRGEGLHLLPFGVDIEATTANFDADGEQLYQLSKSPEDGFSIDIGDDDLFSPDVCVAWIDLGTEEIRTFHVSGPPGDLEYPVRPTKHDLTCCSDRSPPIAYL